jgi:hypothetical protein
VDENKMGLRLDVWYRTDLYQGSGPAVEVRVQWGTGSYRDLTYRMIVYSWNDDHQGWHASENSISTYPVISPRDTGVRLDEAEEMVKNLKLLERTVKRLPVKPVTVADWVGVLMVAYKQETIGIKAPQWGPDYYDRTTDDAQYEIRQAVYKLSQWCKEQNQGRDLPALAS